LFFRCALALKQVKRLCRLLKGNGLAGLASRQHRALLVAPAAA
jgi:hypothetical protein